MKRSLILLLALHLTNTGCGPDPASTPPSPEEMLETFRIGEEFRVEIFAAEPDVTDPVDLAFDEQGRAWVAEMRDYPYQPPEGGPFLSRVRVLEDRDGDGRVDHSTVFAEGLPNVKSVLPWKDGVLVSAAPNILYLRDTDGDLRADETTPLFTGFTILVDPEGQLSNLRFGIDNWIYAGNDSQAGQIRFSRRPGAEPVSVLNADFRFRLDRDLFEAASGATRFGLSFDEWGRRFFSQSGRHIQHVVAARRYLQRNLFLTAPPVTPLHLRSRSAHLPAHSCRGLARGPHPDAPAAGAGTGERTASRLHRLFLRSDGSHHLHRRHVSRALPGQRLRRGRGGQHRPPRRCHSQRGQFRRRPARGGTGPGVHGFHFTLVSARQLHRRSGRQPLRRRHLPPVRGDSGLHPRTHQGRPRLLRRNRSWPHLPDRAPGLRLQPSRPSPNSTKRTHRNWSGISRRRTSGGASPPSGSCSSGRTGPLFPP